MTQLGDQVVAAFAGAAVYLVTLLEVAGLARAVDKVAQRAAAGNDGSGQHVADGAGQAQAVVPRQRIGRARRVDAGQEQRLVGVDIAHAHHHVVVHDHQLDGAAAPARGRVQRLAVEGVGQRFRPQRRQQRVRLGRAGLPQQRAEAARVAQAQAPSAVQQQVHVIVALRRRVVAH